MRVYKYEICRTSGAARTPVALMCMYVVCICDVNSGLHEYRFPDFTALHTPILQTRAGFNSKNPKLNLILYLNSRF